jgi:two-component system OmpR family response regulator
MFSTGTAIAALPRMLSQESRSACAGVSVLVIDDNHYLRDVVRVILEREGATVLDTASVQQARAVLERYVPDVIITDLEVFPEIRGGVQMLDFVKRRYSSCPVVLLTGRSDTYEELCAIGFDEVVFKPASTTALIGAVLAAIRRCRSESTRQTTAA